MQAERALRQSEVKLIEADTPRGLVTILQEAAAETFLLRFVPSGPGGRLDGPGAMTVGSYDDLDTAVTIAAVKYGVSGGGWWPAGASSLRPRAPGARRP